MSEQPQRIRLSRAKGWRMPPNTVKVDRSTPWGNPFVVGKDGNAAHCVELYVHMIGGNLAVAMTPTLDELREKFSYINAHWRELRGKNLACWCKIGQPCHADALLKIVNAEDRVPV